MVSNVILVHGAWVDGSCWNRIIPALTAADIAVTAVQLPLTSFDEDVATVRRAIALVDGEAVLVGHSYAGAVIREAGNDPKIARLVYIDAFAPDTGESAGSLFAQFESAPLNREIRQDANGFLKLTAVGVSNLFAQDLDAADQAILHATQGPIHGAALGGTLLQAAWRTRPTYYLIGNQDQAILRVDQERMAARMNAVVEYVEASHVPMLSHPDVVTKLILKAAA
jgi:pimeloyl-ACP methyl ester carboxylesterase